MAPSTADLVWFVRWVTGPSAAVESVTSSVQGRLSPTPSDERINRDPVFISERSISRNIKNPKIVPEAQCLLQKHIQLPLYAANTRWLNDQMVSEIKFHRYHLVVVQEVEAVVPVVVEEEGEEGGGGARGRTGKEEEDDERKEKKKTEKKTTTTITKTMMT